MICPKCGSKDVSMIMYGLVNDPPSKEEQKTKKIRLGRCVIGPDSTKWECDDCFFKWGTVN
jgi:hypothetical protein